MKDRMRVRRGVRTLPPPHRSVACSVCGVAGWKSKTMAAVYICQPCRREAKGRSLADRSSACAYCGGAFEAKPHSRLGWTRSCSKSCAAKLRGSGGPGGGVNARLLTESESRTGRRMRTQRRRGRMYEVVSERYTKAEIAERDGFRCGLCGNKVDMRRKYPDMRSPEIDHVWPLAKGGDDTRTNVQLAHRACNLSKRDRVEVAQLRLIG